MFDTVRQVLYIICMYASEKYVRVEVKEIKESIHAVANDLGSDLIALHEMVIQLRERIDYLESQLKGLSDE
jgi:polyhydroxyalkanoate synthesis regulator phasin